MSRTGSGTGGHSVSVSAPGKLYLLGEYAVLDGAPALLSAIDRRVTVTASALAADSPSMCSLTAPELGIVDRMTLGMHGALPEDLPSALRAKLTLFDNVRSAVDSFAPATDDVDIRIESAGFLFDGHKLGLGSSAAVAVALTAALAAHRGVPLTPSALFTLAFGAHTAAQDGKGSGGDIAASVYGGHILFRQGYEPHNVNWPDELTLFAVVTGTGSSTVDLVAQVTDYAARNPARYRQDLDHLCALANRTEEALESTDTFLALADEYFLALEILDAHAQAGIVTERHRELRALAATSGAVFKTSGAGGGDLGLIFAKLDSADQLQSVFTEAGATVIPVPYSPDGVRMEHA